ncbi:recombinase family protein [Mucilaginibacter sp. FT3.2]|uniref:recombinase family protein n=1 Tax=Mucilaginibacter sp. FT3.2 TaxID=2723090 RepID=UPI0016111039|nr:recombinase family protein [Mucilaginibacter sp. FT3.2]MBB6231909.1 DNA invertase Pin-like site-specific DNA recombinase [Mucilaginibacter sp. FT3.2]
MNAAYLYIRVSTDEQADKGYSQRNQDEVLRRYCQLQGITVENVIYEDHSAKTFNRPAWQQMLAVLKKNKRNRPGLILFTKWDRFSRNAGDAYQMIGQLRALGAEPQAIEQPLDLSVPENKMMLAFYLAAPEVENDRRALNIFHGMRRAKKEGRWTSSAPAGYANKSYEDGRKYIAINQSQAEIMSWAFKEIATGKYPVEQIYKKAKNKGLACGRNNFWNLIRNPIYCGKISIQAYKDEPMQLATGQHEAIITEDLFNKVQIVLNGRKRQKIHMVNPSEIVLRGYLKCPKCTRMLTGSPSKGSRAYYYYYHCSSSCGVRFNADKVNRALLTELCRYKVQQGFTGLFKKVVQDVLKFRSFIFQNQHQLTSKQLEDQQTRLERAKDLLLAGDLDGDDYRNIKREAENKINNLNAALTAIDDPMQPVHRALKKYEKELLNLAFFYQKATVEQKRKLICLLFPGNLKYTDSYFDIDNTRDVLRIVYNI